MPAHPRRSTPLPIDAPAVTPRGPVLRRLREAGGQLTERQVVTAVPYGSAACRRVLSELETDGLVERRDVGPNRIVTVTRGHSTTDGA